MEELVGKLSALDVDASESLKVVAFFDDLSANGAGRDSLLRGAAVLAGATAGFERNGRIVRYLPSGQRLTGPADPSLRGDIAAAGDAVVWLERAGPAHANDGMIVERLAHAIRLLHARHEQPSWLAVAINIDASAEERLEALARLGISPGTEITLVATSPGEPAAGSHPVTVPTQFGMLQAQLAAAPDRPAATLPASTHAGFGRPTRADLAPASWADAVVAHRLTTTEDPQIHASDLGVLMPVLQAYRPGEPQADVEALKALNPPTAKLLRALVEAESVRAAATRLNLHHSTVQSKHKQLTERLGFDPRTLGGRARYVIAHLISRLEPDA